MLRTGKERADGWRRGDKGRARGGEGENSVRENSIRKCIALHTKFIILKIARIFDLTKPKYYQFNNGFLDHKLDIELHLASLFCVNMT